MEDNMDELTDFEKKKLKIMQLLPKAKAHNYFVRRFFDIDSDEMLDEKIQVLTDLANGKKMIEIPNFYNILELYPKDGEMWD